MTDFTFPLRSAFLALPLEDAAKAEFQALQKSLEPFDDIFRLQNPESPHLTLIFWKELMEIEYNQILPQAEKIATKAAPFSLEITGADTFGDGREERVLYLTVAFSDELARLKKLCPWPQDQEFRPHITLARMKHPQKFAVKKKRILKLVEGASFPMHCDRLRLYAEIDGRKQTPLQDFPLSA